METLDWRVDYYGRLGGRELEKVGDPRVVETEMGPAFLFDGVDDALFLPTNPLEGMSEYTVEVVFRPDPDGPEEQRFLHAGTVDGDRLLLETRPAGAGGWCLDTFVASGAASKPLLDRSLAHPLAVWHAVAAVVGNGRLAAYVDGVEELAAELTVGPAPAGRLSLGCRQNRISWFKGAIARLRITPRVLAPSELLSVPRRPS